MNEILLARSQELSDVVNSEFLAELVQNLVLNTALNIVPLFEFRLGSVEDLFLSGDLKLPTQNT